MPDLPIRLRLMTRCVVFDFGNVIALFDHMVACRQLASLSRLPSDPADVYERIFKTSLEEDYDCGRVSTAAFIERLRQDLHLDASDDEIARAWCDIFTPNPAIDELIVREKQRGTRLVLGSNTNELHYQWFSRVFERVLQLFDEQVLSFRVGARKPDVRFFEACIRASGRAADQIIYLDDRPDYVATASALGIRAFIYDPARPAPAV
jgi:glucose-1-phosphatase